MIKKNSLTRWEEDKLNSVRAVTMDTIKGFYRASINADLYKKFSAKFNSCKNKKQKQNLIREVLKTADREYIYIESDEDTKKYLETFLGDFFSRGYVNDLPRPAISDALLATQMQRQNFTCPWCNGVLDPNIKSGGLKPVGDHLSAISRVGDNNENLKTMHGKDAIEIYAAHAECNERKGSKEYLFRSLEELNKK